MTRSEVYDAIRDFVTNNVDVTGYVFQKRFWMDTGKNKRYIVLQEAGGGNIEESHQLDSFRLLFISSIDDPNIDEVENLADEVRQQMTDIHSHGKIFLFEPISGIPAVKSKEGRYIFTVAFHINLSRGK